MAAVEEKVLERKAGCNGSREPVAVALPVAEGAEEIAGLVSRAEGALAALETLTQEQVDAIVKAMTLAGIAKRLELARLAVDETGMGVFEDKVTKNLFGTEYVYNSIKDEKTVGVIAEDEQEGLVTIAEPVGVIAALTPVTNPTSTTLFKALIALKARNPIILPSTRRRSGAAPRQPR